MTIPHPNVENVTIDGDKEINEDNQHIDNNERTTYTYYRFSSENIMSHTRINQRFTPCRMSNQTHRKSILRPSGTAAAATAAAEAAAEAAAAVRVGFTNRMSRLCKAELAMAAG